MNCTSTIEQHHQPELGAIVIAPSIRRRTSVSEVVRDLHALMKKCGYRRATRDSGVGKKTVRDRRVVLTHCLQVMHRKGFKLRKLDNLRAEHLHCVVDDCRDRNLTAATTASYLSHLRTLCRWTGKPQLIDELACYVDKFPGLIKRSNVATADKSVTGAGLDPVVLIRAAAKECEYFGCQLALGLAFGCRAQESWRFQPNLIDESGGIVTITRGTKGGRPRLIPVACTYQHAAVLGWARSLTTHKAQWMIPPDSCLRKWRRRFYHLCEKIGLTRKQLKVTAHAFRHERMNDLYEWLTGANSPVRGGALHRTKPEVDHAARQLIASVAGHNRLFAAGAYIGGVQNKSSGDEAPEKSVELDAISTRKCPAKPCGLAVADCVACGCAGNQRK